MKFVHRQPSLRAWTNVKGNLGSLAVNEITSDPGPSNRVLVTTERGIFSAETGGDNWVASHAGINAHSIRPFSLSDSELFAPSSAPVSILNGSDVLRPINVAGLFAATSSASTRFSLVSLGRFPDTKVLGVVVGRVARFEDSGQHWSPVSGAPTNVQLLSASRSRPATVLAIDNNEKLFRSTNDGDTFQDVTAQLPAGRTITKIQFAHSQPAVAYASFVVSDGMFLSFGLYKTVDGGATFVELPLQGGLSSAQITALAIDPLDAQVVYVGGFSSVVKSSDGGVTWQRMPMPPVPALEGIMALHVDPVRPRILYALTPAVALRSVNGGRTWQGLTPLRTLGSLNQDVVTDPARAGVIRVATGANSIQQMTISPDVAIAATDMPATLASDAPVEVTYTVSNRGPFDASGIGAILRLPSILSR